MYNIILSNKCNLSCDYCFASEFMQESPQESAPDTNVMSQSTFKKTVDFLAHSKVSHISLLGGEPTLHPHFTEFVEYILLQKIPVSIKSNALWAPKTLDFFNQIKSDNIYYFLNINGPAFLTAQQWEKIKSNVRNLKSRNIVFQLNIDQPEFEYKAILDFAHEVNVGKLFWNLSVPIQKNTRNTFVPYRQVKSHYSKRLLEFIAYADKKKIKTHGVHGPTPCMFEEGEFENLIQWGGSINSHCTPVFDFFPDQTIHYCFPLKDIFKKVSIDDFTHIDEVDEYFLSKAIPMRAKLFPWKECFECSYAISGQCHGGCLSQKTDFSDALVNFPKFSKQLIFIQAKIKSITNDKNIFFLKFEKQIAELDESSFRLWEKFDGTKNLATIHNEYFNEYDFPTLESATLELARQNCLLVRPMIE